MNEKVYKVFLDDTHFRTTYKRAVETKAFTDIMFEDKITKEDLKDLCFTDKLVLVDGEYLEHLKDEIERLKTENEIINHELTWWRYKYDELEKKGDS